MAIQNNTLQYNSIYYNMRQYTIRKDKTSQGNIRQHKGRYDQIRLDKTI